MKLLSLLLTFTLLLISQVRADVAPNPIIAKGVRTTDSCSIQMISEYVYADLYQNYAKVECTFELLNFGDSVTIQVGFPEMHFQYFWVDNYDENHMKNYTIVVDGKTLTDKDIRMSKEFDSAYTAHRNMEIISKEYRQKKLDLYTSAALDSLNKCRKSAYRNASELSRKIDKYIEAGNFPWYVWDMHFDKNEKKQIKVVYSLPAGKGVFTDSRQRRNKYNYFKYILETGSGWYGPIGQANIELKLHNIGLKTIEEISPAGYQLNGKTKRIKWGFTNLEPTKEDDISVRYFNRSDRRKIEKYYKKRKDANIDERNIQFSEKDIREFLDSIESKNQDSIEAVNQ